MVCRTISLQRHLSASAKFAHVESRLCGHKRPGKAGFYTSTTLCVRKHVCRSVVVGIIGHSCLGRQVPEFNALGQVLNILSWSPVYSLPQSTDGFSDAA